MAALTAPRYTSFPLRVERPRSLFLGMHRARDSQDKAVQILRYTPGT